jgi:hypothetical protein
VHTTLNVTGRPAQFGRGVMSEVGGKLIGIFAANLAEMLAGEPAPDSSEADSGDAAEGGLSQPIEELNLSLRSYNSLRRHGIHTLSDLAAQTPEDLLAVENIGPASVEEIRRKLVEHGLTLSESRSGGNGTAEPVAASAVGTAVGAVNGSGPAPAAAGTSTWSAPDDDAIDLLSVAGGPMLKRVIPVAVVVGVVGTVIVLGLRSRRRRSGA